MQKEIKVSSVTPKSTQQGKDYLLIATETDGSFSRWPSGSWIAPGPEMAIGGLYLVDYELDKTGKYKRITKVTEIGEGPKPNLQSAIAKVSHDDAQDKRTALITAGQVMAQMVSTESDPLKAAKNTVEMAKIMYGGIFAPVDDEREPF